MKAPTITFLCSSGPHTVPVFRLLKELQPAMAEHNVLYEHIWEDSHYAVASHQALHTLFTMQTVLTEQYTPAAQFHLFRCLQNFDPHIAEGKNLLFALHFHTHKPLISFLQALKRRPGAERYTFRVVFLLSHPLLVSEHYGKFLYPTEQAAFGKDIADYCVDVHHTVDAVVDEIGLKNVSFLVNKSTSAEMGFPDDTLLEQLFQKLGCSNVWPVSSEMRNTLLTAPHKIHLHSPAVRHLYYQFFITGSAWPCPEYGRDNIYAEMLALDASIARPHFSVLAPETIRKILEISPAIAGHLSETYLESSSVFGESWEPDAFFSPRTDWKPYTGFSKEWLDILFANLAPAVQEILWQRLAASKEVLGKEQAYLLDYCQTHFAPKYTATQHVDVLAKPRVTVLTMTRNHSSFIGACMDSVLEQETTFPVEHVVLDDCSDDDTRAVITEYAARYPSIRPVFLHSKACGGENVSQLLHRGRSPFVALCDGDDYFCDTKKLQKQLEFLEKNDDCSVCFHLTRVSYEDGSGRASRTYPPLEELPQRSSRKFYLSDLLRCNLMQTSSVMYRWRFEEGLPAWFNAAVLPGDWYWHLLHAEKGKIGFIEEVMSIYRRTRGAVFYSADSNDTLHKELYGIQELHLYAMLNEHFEKRYQRILDENAMGVISGLVGVAQQSGNASFLRNAEELFPYFMRKYREKCKQLLFHRGK